MKEQKVKWGILSTAKIAVDKVIPAMQQSKWCEIVAIASREEQKAQLAAEKLGIDKAYGSYETLLADPDIDAVYNPLPNHLHVPWTIRALEAGKHVLCEKPIGLNATEAKTLLQTAQRFPHLKVMEAFMYRFHPQWRKARELVEGGAIGQLRTIHTLFSYYNDDPANVRNQSDIGGGGLLDIGCYAVSLSRLLFDEEPHRVFGLRQIHPQFRVDTLTSGILQFSAGTATFTVGTLLQPYQRIHVFGTKGRIEIEIPFNAPPDRPTRLWLQRGGEMQEIVFPICNQYTLQGDAFSRAVLEDRPVPTPLEDTVANMRALDALIEADKTGKWVEIEKD
ncbi:MAG: Gfo/Idh/MocA family oxidoreductase [candidate division KSB1 bacterium]|nr:Gfo/Idh/MocA family oxidoreductase [candidate division KSB1 bacterium]